MGSYLKSINCVLLIERSERMGSGRAPESGSSVGRRVDGRDLFGGSFGRIYQS